MGSENGRGFVGDRERFTASERRELGRLDERAAAAGKRVTDGEIGLERFKPHLGEAFLEGKDPPRAAVDLQRQVAEGKNTKAACAAVRPGRVRALEVREAEWFEKRAPEIRKRSEEALAEVAAGFRTAAEVLDVYEVHRADVALAAPVLAPPQLPNLRSRIGLLLDTIAAWPPKPTAPNGLIAVRLSTTLPKTLKQGHRLGDAVTAARARLQLERYGPDDTFGISPQYAELLPHLGLELVDQPHEPGVTP